ncbi:MAG: hypothetical protein C0596_17690 [Marinilabiliales bacterium]|nr:MAG: hypothetical protein C0596_17690 [Marinilabiliales bacterium]
MLENKDFVYIPNMKFVDIIDSGMAYYGSAIMTQRYIFLLVDTIDSVEEKRKSDCYNRLYVEKVLSNPQDFDVLSFETAMLTDLDELHIFPFADLKKFEVTVGFSIFGGIKMVKNTKTLTSMSIKDVKVRKAIKEFYGKYIK